MFHHFTRAVRIIAECGSTAWKACSLKALRRLYEIIELLVCLQYFQQHETVWYEGKRSTKIGMFRYAVAKMPFANQSCGGNVSDDSAAVRCCPQTCC